MHAYHIGHAGSAGATALPRPGVSNSLLHQHRPRRGGWSRWPQRHGQCAFCIKLWPIGCRNAPHRAGYYCPNTTVQIICPKGYYCKLQSLYPVKCRWSGVRVQGSGPWRGEGRGSPCRGRRHPQSACRRPGGASEPNLHAAPHSVQSTAVHLQGHALCAQGAVAWAPTGEPGAGSPHFSLNCVFCVAVASS